MPVGSSQYVAVFAFFLDKKGAICQVSTKKIPAHITEHRVIKDNCIYNQSVIAELGQHAINLPEHLGLPGLRVRDGVIEKSAPNFFAGLCGQILTTRNNFEWKESEDEVVAAAAPAVGS